MSDYLPSKRGESILVVEDNKDTAYVMQKMLSAQYDVDTAFTIAEAIEKALHKTYALVISDIGLPDGHGISLLTAMRQFSKTPAIALTGYGSEEDIKRCLEAGFDHHLTKPVTHEALTAAVSRLLAPVAAAC